MVVSQGDIYFCSICIFFISLLDYIYIYNTIGSIDDHERQRTRNSGKGQNIKNIYFIDLIGYKVSIHVLRSVMLLILVQFYCYAIVNINSVSVCNKFVSDLWNK